MVRFRAVRLEEQVESDHLRFRLYQGLDQFGMQVTRPAAGFPRQAELVGGLCVERDDDIRGRGNGAAQLEQPQQAEVFFQLGCKRNRAEHEPRHADGESQAKPLESARHIQSSCERPCTPLLSPPESGGGHPIQDPLALSRPARLHQSLHQFPPPMHPELVIDRLHVIAHGVEGDVQLLGDLGVLEVGGQRQRDLFLHGGEG